MLGWVVALVLATVLVSAVALYERELGRIAGFLKRGDRTVNERVTVGFSTPGISSVAAAANDEMDALRDERAALGERQEAFQRDLAALSHDIRTPLAGAQGYLQLYRRTADEAERARCLEEAASRLNAMRELTDRLFEYAKAADADSPLACEPVEALPVLAEVLVGLYPQFEQKGWEPEIRFADEGVEVFADEEALSRVFSNLLANALRYGTSAPVIEQRALEGERMGAAFGSGRNDAGGTVEGGGAGRQAGRAWTSGEAERNEADGSSAQESCAAALVAVTFSNKVADPASIDADRLFERFYRADGARSGDGSGLGLAIVASLCQRMGGYASAHLKGDELSVEVLLSAVR